MTEEDRFGPVQWFDRDAAKRSEGGRLPHFEMPGAIYYVTFRLIDSLPTEASERLLRARDEFLRLNPPPHTAEQEMQLKHIYSVPLERSLDGGFGECWLRKIEVRQCLEDALLSFDGVRYQRGEYVIMPNHVHLLARMAKGVGLRKQCQSWTSTRPSG